MYSADVAPRTRDFVELFFEGSEIHRFSIDDFRNVTVKRGHLKSADRDALQSRRPSILMPEKAAN